MKQSYFSKFFYIIIGVIMNIINHLFKIKEEVWLFGAFHNIDYRESPKYLFEYVNNNKRNIKCVWISRNNKVVHIVRSKGFIAYHNLSIRGLYYTLIGSRIITSTQFGGDLNFCFKKTGRKYIYLIHGMPIKKCFGDTPKKYLSKPTLFGKLYMRYVACFTSADIDLVTSTSHMFSSYLRTGFPNAKILNLGMPRNDLFLNPMLRDDNFETIVPEYKNCMFVITYMPTHRGYGRGEPSPTLFINNEFMMNWFQSNNVLLLIKNHPNMANKIYGGEENGNIIEITKRNIDPQILLCHTDILITDFSSCWVDYLLLGRPIIFYFYDDYDVSDNETYFDIKNECINIGFKSFNERELSDLIIKLYGEYNIFKLSPSMQAKYHKHIDSNSSQRNYEAIKML